MGDPIEIGAAAAVYLHGKQPGQQGLGQEAGQPRPLAWVTVKGYGGHQEAAAGGPIQ